MANPLGQTNSHRLQFELTPAWTRMALHLSTALCLSLQPARVMSRQVALRRQAGGQTQS